MTNPTDRAVLSAQQSQDRAECARPTTTGRTCVQSLAAGWIGAPDLCPVCTRAFMAACESIGQPLRWHPNFRTRARR